MTATPDLAALAARHRATLAHLAAADARREAARARRLARWPGARRAAPRPLPEAGLTAALGSGGRVLVMRPDHLGDVLFVGPALRLLGDALPSAAITLLVGPWSRPVAERLPGRADVQTLDFPYFNRRREAAWRRYARLLVGAWRLRRHGPFAAALVLRDDDWASAWLARLSGAQTVVAHEQPLTAVFADLMLPAAKRPAHTAAANLALVGAVLAGPNAGVEGPHTWDRHPLAFRLTADDRAKAAALLAVEGRPIAIHPGAGAAVKRWSAAAWAESARQLTAPGEPVVLTGSRGEAPLTAEVAAALAGPSVDLAGRTDLAALAAVFERCRLVMGPDSGPLHLASAVGTPTVHLYGPADPARFGPWGPPDRHRVVMSAMACAPCGRLDWRDVAEHPCVRATAVEDLVAAARSCSAETPSTSRAAHRVSETW